ncbi:DUF421 domain-containing protein [Crassaminicella indica]|uniref:DUF421 domain-containing protein n=1 Tax=Crassaminicella indica TaxID=2855394 RepID=A0ABX8RD11_9CLOT|nr:DUF421 domain-containing protein [Crassaminicella indica]QXM06656.1 DUF421 domain-containing protein [Crassaminicella indica]
MVIILIRTVLLYIFVLFCIRLMGKGELSEMQPFELVILLMISELAALPMENTALPLLNGLTAIIALLFIQVVLSYINLKSEKARKIICGKPSILIDHGHINEKEMKRLRINMNDLIEQMRVKNYHNIADVEFAILETNGDLSIVPKAEKKTVTLEDMHIKPPDNDLPVTLIIDGHINEHNLSNIDCSKDWLISQIKAKGVKNPKDVLFCYIDANKNVYVYKKDKV